MKRLIFSILGGLLFPVIYTVVVGTLSDYFPQYFPDRIYLFGKPTFGWIFAPIAVPFWIYSVIEYYRFFGLPFIFNTTWFRVVFTIGFDVLLYTMLTYAVLWYFGIFKKKTQQTLENPPPPPAQF